MRPRWHFMGGPTECTCLIIRRGSTIPYTQRTEGVLGSRHVQVVTGGCDCPDSAHGCVQLPGAASPCMENLPAQRGGRPHGVSGVGRRRVHGAPIHPQGILPTGHTESPNPLDHAGHARWPDRPSESSPGAQPGDGRAQWAPRASGRGIPSAAAILQRCRPRVEDAGLGVAPRLRSRANVCR